MIPLYYLLLLQPQAAPPPALPPPAAGGSTRPRRPMLAPAPDFTEFVNREEEEALVLCGALG